MRRQIGVYQARVEAAPMVEQQLATVQRDYDLEKQQYADLSAKLHAAASPRTSSATAAASSSRCSIRRRYPTEPTKPIPLRVMLMSILGGPRASARRLTLGREYLDRSVHDVRELRDEFELPVLGEVTHIRPAGASPEATD